MLLLTPKWNLLSDFLHSKDSDLKNPFGKMKDKAAEQLISPYFNSYSNPVSVLNQEKPNVVLIILESFTADLIEGLGGEAGVAPNFEKLIQDGVLFTNIYATSDRTDKGFIAIMSAFFHLKRRKALSKTSTNWRSSQVLVKIF